MDARTRPHRFELLQPERNRGLGLLPAPSAGDIFFDVQNSDVSLAAASFQNGGDVVQAGLAPDRLNVLNSTVNVSTGFGFSSAKPITVQLDNSVFNTNTLILRGSNWVLSTTPPTVAGTFNVTEAADLFTGGDLLTYANFNVMGSVVLLPAVAGDLQVGNYTGTESLFLQAGGSVTMGDVSVANLDIIAPDSITTVCVRIQTRAAASRCCSFIQSFSVVTTGPLPARCMIPAASAAV